MTASDPLLALKRLLLRRLQAAKGQKLPASQFRLYANNLKQLAAEEAQVQAARDELVKQALIAEMKSGGGRSYTLTPAGIEFLRTPTPPPSGYDELLLPYHRSYLLFLLLRSEERKASLAELCSRIDTKSAKGKLGFGQVANDHRILVNRSLVGWLLDALTAAGAVTRTESKGMPSYRLTEAGEELLGASEQYPTITFTLTGQELTDLIAAARLARTAVVEPPDAKREEQVPAAAVLTAEQVVAEFERLKQEQYAQHGMVPIHILRQTVAERFGTEAAEHDSLDPLLKELRRSRQIRLVALGNAGDASEQELADSICGENETYFAIESAHDHAPVG